MTEVLATVSASLPRRALGVAMLYGLGALLIWLALGGSHPALGWKLLLLGLGAGGLVLGEVMRRATRLRLELTEEGLRDSDGRLLAPLEEIRGIERGMLAMKPSNGFTLRLSAARGRLWAPGVYWRLGRRLGVGGVTSAGQSKFMAEMLTAMLAEQTGHRP